MFLSFNIFTAIVVYRGFSNHFIFQNATSNGIYGHVAIRVNGKFDYVQQQGWDDADAAVLCREIGFQSKRFL
jgi:hypothetical protein